MGGREDPGFAIFVWGVPLVGSGCLDLSFGVTIPAPRPPHSTCQGESQTQFEWRVPFRVSKAGCWVRVRTWFPGEPHERHPFGGVTEDCMRIVHTTKGGGSAHDEGCMEHAMRGIVHNKMGSIQPRIRSATQRGRQLTDEGQLDYSDDTPPQPSPKRLRRSWEISPAVGGQHDGL